MNHFRKSICLLVTLTLVMILTRGNHFSGFNALPEASWMTFMVAGALLPAWSFAWFMAIAVIIDAYAFSFGGVSGTCLSFAYSMLIPAYFSMWFAGRLSKFYLTGELPGFAVFFGFAVLGTALCELISSGSFYLWSGNFEPTLGEFMSRELKYAPAAFSSSAFWAIVFITVSAVYRGFKRSRGSETLTQR